MAISPDYYPPFDPRELPANPSPRMQTALQALYRASVEVHRTLYRLALLHEITRSPEFVRVVNNAALAYPMLTIRSGLTYSAAISVYAVFDTDESVASIRKVLSTLADRREEDCIRQLHGPCGTGLDADAVIARLRRLQRRLNRSEISGVVDRLKDLRNQQLAHFDLNLTIDQGAPKMADMDRAFAFAANVANTATLAVVKRLLKTREAYEDARKQARDFTASLMREPAEVKEQ